MPETVPLVCHQCGAPIEIDVDQKQCVCAYCGTSLAVVRSDVAIHTDASTNGDPGAATQLEAIRLEEEMSRIDREWRLARTRFRFTKDDDGGFVAPTTEGVRSACIAMVLVAALFGFFGVIASMYPLSLVGLAVGALAVVSYRKGIGLADDYAIAEKGYRLRRGVVLGKLQALANPSIPTPARSLGRSVHCPMCSKRMDAPPSSATVTCPHCATSFMLDPRPAEAT